jgi:hypothetical protein
MVFFHGGLFISGGAQMYRPKYFMDEDIILVVPQYRLGALGRKTQFTFLLVSCIKIALQMWSKEGDEIADIAVKLQQ